MSEHGKASCIIAKNLYCQGQVRLSSSATCDWVNARMLGRSSHGPPRRTRGEAARHHTLDLTKWQR